MQRRQFLRNALSLGAAGLVLPTVGLANNPLVLESCIPDKTEQLRLLRDEVSQCRRCQKLTWKRPAFDIDNPDADILFLAQAPSPCYDEEGKPFVSQRGNTSVRRQLIDIIITKILKRRREDVFVCNILCCRQPENRKPYPQEVTQCHSFVDRTLEIVKPKLICCLGRAASQSLLGSDKPPQTLRGRVHDYNGISVVCTYQPGYLLQRSHVEKIRTDMQLLLGTMEH